MQFQNDGVDEVEGDEDRDDEDENYNGVASLGYRGSHRRLRWNITVVDRSVEKYCRERDKVEKTDDVASEKEPVQRGGIFVLIKKVSGPKALTKILIVETRACKSRQWIGPSTNT